MRKIDLEEIKKIELDMVKCLDQICRENGLTYFAVGGTLLGAVRHGGFIPWDDDIDIGMPREDFDRLRDLLEREKGFYEIAFFDNCKDYGYASPKMLDTRTRLIDYKHGNGKEESSVFIDIFLFDGMGQSRVTALLRYYFLKIFKRAVFLSRRNFVMETPVKTIVFAIPWVVCRLIGSDTINRWYNWFCAGKKMDDTKYVATAAGVYGAGEVFQREVFTGTIDLKFEDAVLKAPVGYKEYLTSLYGNYMEMPPADKRVSNHTSEEWWKD